VRLAEELGYEACYVTHIAGRESLTLLTIYASATERLRIGTGVVPIYTRTPATMAQTAATINEFSHGRLRLGLGVSHRPVVEGWHGQSIDSPAGEMREYVAIVRAILRGEDPPAGTKWSTGFRLAGVDLAPDMPIYIAALSPLMLRLAGEIADGVILNWCPPERVAFARARIAEGAEAAERDPASVMVAVYVRAWVGPEETEAMSALRAMAGQYASYRAYRRQFDEVGLGPQAAVAGQAHRAGRPEDVPEVLVRAVCAVGGEARDRVEAFREAGADLPIVYPVATADAAASIETTLRALAPGRDPTHDLRTSPGAVD
jgi:alkanesulfonate monooxygenase SsuD/methylene tetrahydromethanopterin reductase-like flavin-dependent oxidoreductase (luciferase family)